MPEPQPRSRVAHIVVLGMMGSGKTTVGRLLAHHLGRPFRDSDDDVRRVTGRDAGTIASQDGVAALHAIETRLLLETLRSQPAAVIAAAASVVEDVSCREALAGHTCVWLDADVATLAARQPTAGHRRTLADTAAELADLKRVRDPHYRALAAVTVDTAVTDLDGALADALVALSSSTEPPPQRDP